VASSVLAQTLVEQATPRAVAHNVVILVADGLHPRSVNIEAAPNLTALARQRVSLVNSHAVLPTLTMANALVTAPSHSGVFANTLFAGFAVPSACLENDAVRGASSTHFRRQLHQ
jgi:predicted AlkP superfamily pyrophosphatase or phosphodiesterase